MYMVRLFSVCFVIMSIYTAYAQHDRLLNTHTTRTAHNKKTHAKEGGWRRRRRRGGAGQQQEKIKGLYAPIIRWPASGKIIANYYCAVRFECFDSLASLAIVGRRDASVARSHVNYTMRVLFNFSMWTVAIAFADYYYYYYALQR